MTQELSDDVEFLLDQVKHNSDQIRLEAIKKLKNKGLKQYEIENLAGLSKNYLSTWKTRYFSDPEISSNQSSNLSNHFSNLSNHKLPSFNELVRFISKNPDHIHYKYWMREVRNGKKTLIEDNQAILMKLLSLIHDFMRNKRRLTKL